MAQRTCEIDGCSAKHRAKGMCWQHYKKATGVDYCCAYCGTKPDRLDPDHVVPLSRGGYDSPANLLPACMECNSSKSAMMLAEWGEWRAAHSLASRATTWAADDERYHHLTQPLLESVA